MAKDATLYTQPATALTPALIIFLIDISDSMNQTYGSTTKIALVNAALRETIRRLVGRSSLSGVIQSNYEIALFSYHTKVSDVLDGICSLPTLIQQGGIPPLHAQGETCTSAGFAAVEGLLGWYLASLKRTRASSRPVPLVCHVTDAHFTTDDPSSIVNRIRALHVPDGAVLVEHIYVADGMLRQPVDDWHQWGGVRRASMLTEPNVKRLFALSSPLPEVYRHNINDTGYHLQKGAVLLFPGIHHDLIQLACAVPAGTQLR